MIIPTRQINPISIRAFIEGSKDFHQAINFFIFTSLS